MSVELVDHEDADPVTAHLDVDHPIGSTRVAGWDRLDALIDEWGRQSFPASDPPSNW
jgi:hypothetical protein